MKFPTDFGERPCKGCGVIIRKTTRNQERCTPCQALNKKEYNIRWIENEKRKKAAKKAAKH